MDNSSSTCKLPRFTVFEFTDKSLAVGESEWICDVDELTAESFDTEATIEVMWPENASSIVRHKMGKGKKPSLKEPIKTHEAMALFFTENLDEANLKCRELANDVIGVTDGNKRIARKRRFSASEEEADVDHDKNEVQSSAVTMQNNQDDDKIITVLSGIAQSLDRIESLLRDKKACTEIRYPDMRSQTPSSARTGGQTWSSQMSEHLSPSLSTLHSSSTAPSTPKSIHTTTDIPVPNEGNSDMVVLKGNVRIARGMLNRCEDVDPKRFVSKLMIAMWGREYLATHSLTGHSKSAGGSEKEILDQEVLTAIEEYTLKKFCGFSIQDFRAAVRGKLNSEDKMYKIRQQPKI